MALKSGLKIGQKIVACSEASAFPDLLSREEIALQFKQHWERRGFNVRDVARHYSVTIQYVSAVRTGAKPPNKEMLADMGVQSSFNYWIFQI